MKTYYFTLPQQTLRFKVKAKNKEEAKEILETCDDITEYGYEDYEIWQPEFEYEGEEKE